MKKLLYSRETYTTVDGSKILLSLFEKCKNEPWVLSMSEIEKKKESWFPGKWGESGFRLYKHKFGLLSGITINNYDNMFFLVDKERCVDIQLKNISLRRLREIFEIHNSTSIKINRWNNCYIEMSELEIEFMQNFLHGITLEVERIYNGINLREKQAKEKEKRRQEHLQKTQINLIQEFDKDGNGVIDVIEGIDDFMILFKKHQIKIIEVDKQYIQNFVKVSNYLKTKRQNIQDVFSSIKITKNQLQLNEKVGILKNQIHTYELLLFHSLNMIISVVEDDLIIFYEIYESFDKLNIFNSNWENEVAQQLKNIEDGFSELMYSIDSMERNIVSGLNQLTYVTQQGFSDLERNVTKELQSIDSSVRFNNLLTAISTYQLYKINKQTKPLKLK